MLLGTQDCLLCPLFLYIGFPPLSRGNGVEWLLEVLDLYEKVILKVPDVTGVKA